MSIRVGIRPMGRALGKVAPPAWPVLIFEDDYDWFPDPLYSKIFGDDFDWAIQPFFYPIFTENFTGWP